MVSSHPAWVLGTELGFSEEPPVLLTTDLALYPFLVLSKESMAHIGSAILSGHLKGDHKHWWFVPESITPAVVQGAGISLFFVLGRKGRAKRLSCTPAGLQLTM